MNEFAAARGIITDGLAARAFPAAVVDVGRREGSIWCEPFGRLSYEPTAHTCGLDTIFDLASLTKVVATASAAMRLVGAQRLSLDDKISQHLATWRGDDREAVTIRQLLDHSSGLPAHARLWERAAGRTEYERVLAALPLERAPRPSAVYSDPGFMLLGFILADAGGAPLDSQFATLSAELGDIVRYRPSHDLVERIAPTENDPWRGRLLRGEVHDENAAALGGIAGHAGLFGTAGAVAAFARLVLQTFHDTTALGDPSLMRAFATRSDVPGSSRALAWDTMLPTSSCGTRMSPTSIGHTGFTGTSLWIDWEKDLYVVFLTNRVHPTRANDALAKLRPALHDAIVSAVED